MSQETEAEDGGKDRAEAGGRESLESWDDAGIWGNSEETQNRVDKSMKVAADRRSRRHGRKTFLFP